MTSKILIKYLINFNCRNPVIFNLQNLSINNFGILCLPGGMLVFFVFFLFSFCFLSFVVPTKQQNKKNGKRKRGDRVVVSKNKRRKGTLLPSCFLFFFFSFLVCLFVSSFSFLLFSDY